MEDQESSDAWLYMTPERTDSAGGGGGAVGGGGESPKAPSRASSSTGSGRESPYHKKLAELEEALQDEESSTAKELLKKKPASPPPTLTLPKEFTQKRPSPASVDEDLYDGGEEEQPTSSGGRTSTFSYPTSSPANSISASPARGSVSTYPASSQPAHDRPARIAEEEQEQEAPVPQPKAAPALSPTTATVDGIMMPRAPSPLLPGPASGGGGPRFHNPLRRRSSADSPPPPPTMKQEEGTKQSEPAPAPPSQSLPLKEQSRTLQCGITESASSSQQQPQQQPVVQQLVSFFEQQQQQQQAAAAAMQQQQQQQQQARYREEDEEADNDVELELQRHRASPPQRGEEGGGRGGRWAEERVAGGDEREGHGRGRTFQREDDERIITRSDSPNRHRRINKGDGSWDMMTGRRRSQVEDRFSPIHWINRSVTRSLSPERSSLLHNSSPAELERYKRSSSYTHIPHLYTQSYFRKQQYYSSSPVHKRLYALRRTEPAKDRISLSREHTFRPKLATEHFFKARPVYKLKPFNERLYTLEHFLEYYRIGAERKAALEIMGCTFAPEILKKSRDKPKEATPIWDRLYAKRIGEMERRTNRKEAIERAELSLCTFHPDCTRSKSPIRNQVATDTQAGTMSPHERLFEEARGRQERVRERARQIPHGCTFHPQRTAKDLAKSTKSGFERQLELYDMGTVRVTQERLREETRRPKTKKKDDEAECTFFPLTNWARRNKTWKASEPAEGGTLPTTTTTTTSRDGWITATASSLNPDSRAAKATSYSPDRATRATTLSPRSTATSSTFSPGRTATGTAFSQSRTATYTGLIPGRGSSRGGMKSSRGERSGGAFSLGM